MECGEGIDPSILMKLIDGTVVIAYSFQPI